MSPRKLNAVMGAVLSAIGTQKADAGCVGGEQIAAGNYAIEISGKRASGGAEDLSGTITSDGKCTLNVILQGRLNSALVAALSATGGYSVNEDHIGILTLSIDGQPTQRFVIAVLGDRGTLIGLEGDDVATARLDARRGSPAIADDFAILNEHGGNKANAQADTKAPPPIDHTPAVAPTAKSPDEASKYDGNLVNAQAAVTNAPLPVRSAPDGAPLTAAVPTAKSPNDVSKHDGNQGNAPAAANASPPADHAPDHTPPATVTPTAKSPNDKASKNDSNAASAQAVSNAPPPVDHAPGRTPSSAVASTVTAAAANSSATRIVSADPASPLPEKHEKSNGGDVEAKALVSRGDAVFGTGDLTTARAFYRRGAAEGDGTAALRLGETFDPAFLQEAGLGRVAGDLRQAVFWYRRAHDLGNRDADIVLKSIDPPR
jgi:hypothetical protein